MALFLPESAGGGKERTTLCKRTYVPITPQSNYRPPLDTVEAGTVIKGYDATTQSSSNNFYVLPLAGAVGKTLYYSSDSGDFRLMRCGTYYWRSDLFNDRTKMLTEDDDYIWFVPRAMFNYDPSRPKFTSNRIERYDKETATYEQFTFSSNTVNNAQALPSTGIQLGIHFIPKDDNTLLMVYAVARGESYRDSSTNEYNAQYSNIRICYYEIRCNQSDHTASVWQLDTVHSLSDFTIQNIGSNGASNVFASFKDIDNYVYIAVCRENNVRFRECVVNLDTMSITKPFTDSKTPMILGSTIRYKGTSYLAPHNSGIMIPVKVDFVSNAATVKVDTTKDAIIRKPSLYLAGYDVNLMGYLANPEIFFEFSPADNGQYLRILEVTPETISSTSVLDLFNN